MFTRPLPSQAPFGLAALLACCFAAAPVAAAEPATKPFAKPAAKAAPRPAAKARKAPAVPVAAPVAEAGPDQVKAAELVYYGVYDCEFQQTVHITQSQAHTAYVDVKAGKGAWLMKPVLSSTGAVRLEDVRGETLMVQISSKSMLLNVKSAQRIVDDCISPRQRELIAEAKAAKMAADAAALNAPAGTAATTPTSLGIAATPAASPGTSAEASAPK